MRIGVFIGEVSGARTTVDELLAAARDAEARGFACGWVPHIPWSLDALTALALAGQVTARIELGTAVVPTYPRHPLAMAHQAMSTQAATSGRLVLGVGPSHPVVIEGMYGLPYDAPARHTREYIEVLRAAFACTGHVECVHRKVVVIPSASNWVTFRAAWLQVIGPCESDILIVVAKCPILVKGPA